MYYNGHRFLAPYAGRRTLGATVCAIVPLAVLLLMTGAVLPEHAKSQLQLATVYRGVYEAEIERPGVIEPFRSAAVHSECYWNTTILSIVPEGTYVKKGDVVCVLDSSEIQEFAKNRELLLVKYRNRLQNAIQQQRLLRAENERRLDAAVFGLLKAQNAVSEYTEGEFPQQIDELEHNLALLADELQAAVDEFTYSERLWAMGAVSRLEMQQSQLAYHRAQEKYDRMESQLALVSGLVHRRNLLRLEYQADQAQRNVVRTRLTNELALTRNRLTTLSYQRTLQIYERYYQRAIDSIKACTLRAPRDGQVVYGNSWYLRSRGITQIEVGRRIRNRQLVFEIPDPGRLKVSVPVPESQVLSISAGMPVEATLAGYEDKPIAGRVIRVSPYPRPRSSYTPDLKDYWLDVELLPTAAQRPLLKPKADVTVSITVTRLADQLLIPRDSVVGIAGSNYVLVWSDGELQPRQVALGPASETVVCVNHGLQEGDQVAVTMTDAHRQLLLQKIRTDSMQPHGL